MSPCQIKFDKQNGVYHSGEVLSGTVELKLDKPSKIRELTLWIKGVAKAEWNEYTCIDWSATHCGESELFILEMEVVNDSEESTFELPQGTHVYKFATTIPPELPTSFEGYYGHIKYEVTAIVDRPWKINKSYCADFMILQTMDLNLEGPLLRQPFIKTFRFRSGRLELTVEIPYRGYVPGQSIEVKTRIVFNDDLKIYWISSKLYQIEQYTICPEQTRTKKSSVAEVLDPVFDSNKPEHIQQLLVPRVTPNTVTQLLDITYELKVTVKLAWYYNNPRIRIPITIGTVPLSMDQTECNLEPNDVSFAASLVEEEIATIGPTVNRLRKLCTQVLSESI